jgi:GNAT superfamily N-acetyltransferase
MTTAVYGTTDELAVALKDLRNRCWKQFFGNLEFLNDGHDGHALHFLVLTEGSVVASARLCTHNHLHSIAEFHLYPMLDTSKFPGPYAGINRLVVDAQFRGQGIAAILDRIRTETAVRLGCRTMLASWNQHSGDRRRQALQAQGFISVSDDQPLPDGGFGTSFPYAKRIEATLGAHWSPASEAAAADALEISQAFNLLLSAKAIACPAAARSRPAENSDQPSSASLSIAGIYDRPSDLAHRCSAGIAV